MHVLRFIEKSLSRFLRLSFQVINNSISSSSKMAPTVKANAPSEVQIGELEMHIATYFCTRRRRGLFFCKHLTGFYDLGQVSFFGNLTQTTSDENSNRLVSDIFPWKLIDTHSQSA